MYEYRVNLPNIPEYFCVFTGYYSNKKLPCGNAKAFWNIRQADPILINKFRTKVSLCYQNICTWYKSKN